MREVIAVVGQDIPIGRYGEHLATCVRFDISEWVNTYGEGTAHLLHRRNGDSVPYPCDITREDSVVTWVITQSDVDVAGNGMAELQYFVNDALVKSAKYTTVTERSLYRSGEEAPEPYKGWVDNVLMAATNAVESEKSAEEHAGNAEAYAKDAFNYMERARQEAWGIPSLTTEQKDTLKNLMYTYLYRLKNESDEDNFIYDNEVSRNAFAPGGNPYNAEGKIRINCYILPQLVWAGVHPGSYIGKQETYDKKTGTFTKFDNMDWGYQFDYPLRRAYGVMGKDNDGNDRLFGYVDAGENSYSANTYYSKDSTAGGKQGQHFKNYIYGSDMAQEACIKGFEIPLGCADVGDIIFYRAPSLHDGFQDGGNTKAYRNIGHVALVYNVNLDKDGRRDGTLTILESTDYYSSAIARNSIYNENPGDVVRAADLADRACMCIRHPAAFGVPTNVDDCFNILYRGMNQPE